MLDGVGRLSQRWLDGRRAHPFRWQLIELAAGAAGVALVWVVVGKTLGIVAAVLWVALTVLDLVALLLRRARET
jgi:hypothetical protein